MTAINEYLSQAELALAAYSTLTPGTPIKADLVDDGRGMSTAQAAEFASKWTVIAPPYDDPITGVHATVFQSVSGGPKYLAIRGTQGPTDYLADYLILNGTPAQLNPQYLSLKAKVQAWLTDGTLTPGFTVTGHSLGGYLAAGLVAEFPAIGHAYLYNAPGNNSTTAQIMQALGIVTMPDPAKITSLRADAGISPIAALGHDFSPPIPIVIENQFLSDVGSPPAARNHSQQILTDALALYAALAGLSPALTMAGIGQLLQSASAQNKLTLETTLDALRTVLLGKSSVDARPTPEGNRDTFYSNLYTLQDSTAYNTLAGRATLRATATLDRDTLATRAKTDFGTFLAVKYLLPVAMENATATLAGSHGDLHAQWRADATLTAAQRADGQANFSDAYLADRAAMLTWKNKLATEDFDITRGAYLMVMSDGNPNILSNGNDMYWRITA